MNKAKRGWLYALIIGLIAFVCLITPTIIYMFSNSDDFFISGYLATREVYSTDEQEIELFLEQEYPDAIEGDFVRVIDTDSDWDYIEGEWVNFEYQHAHMTTNDFLMSFMVGMIILGLVLLKALNNVSKGIAYPIWLVMFGFMLLFLKGMLVYLPQLMFSVAGGWLVFSILIKIAKRKWDLWIEYKNEYAHIEARNEVG